MYKVFLFTAILTLCLINATYWVIGQPMFGKDPTHEIYDKSKSVPFLANERSVYPIPTPTLKEGSNAASVFWQSFWADKVENVSSTALANVKTKTDLLSLDRNHDVVVRLNHSSFFIQLAGKRILINPVLAKQDSKLPSANKLPNPESNYTARDIPKIDYLLISDDLKNRLDYSSLVQLANKVEKVITPNGLGKHFKHWGFADENIHEADWYSKLKFDEAITFHLLPSQHFSENLLSQGESQSASFAINTENYKIFYGGDNGQELQSKEIADKLDRFDLVLINNNQYDSYQSNFKQRPEQDDELVDNINIDSTFNNHTEKFLLADDVERELFKTNLKNNSRSQSFITPAVGEPYYINNKEKNWSYWWENVD